MMLVMIVSYCVYIIVHFSAPASSLPQVESKSSLELLDISPLPEQTPKIPQKLEEDKEEYTDFRLNVEETKSLLLCVQFVLKYIDPS